MAMVNLDSVGAGTVTVIGSQEMVDLALEAADTIGLGLQTVKLSGMYAGDHLPFIKRVQVGLRPNAHAPPA